MGARDVLAFVLGTSVMVAAAGWSQRPARIEVIHPDRAVTAEGPDLPLVEPHVRVDPSDASHVVVGAIVAAPERSGPWHCAAFASFDAGMSWTRHEFPMDRCIDPWVTFADGGRVLFTGIEIRRDWEGDARFRMLQFGSADGGRTWMSTPVDLGEAHDHGLLAVDRTGEDSGTIYLASRRMRGTTASQPRHTVYVAQSVDGGHTYATLAELRPSNLALNATGVALPGDRLVVTFVDSQRNVDGFEGRGMLARARAWALRAERPAGAFSEPLLITDECASGVEGTFPGYPALARDASRGTFSDRLYHACVRPGLEGIALATSDDGDTWRDPVRVDAAAGRRSAHARTPMLAVNRDGIVVVAWYDRTADPARRCQDVHVAASLDGGATFLAAVRLSTEPSCPDTPGNGRVASSWPMGGDYGSLAAGPDGLFTLVWADSRSGSFRLRSATLRVEGLATEPGRAAADQREE